MITWDRQDKPLAREFENVPQMVGKLDLTDVTPAPADAAIVIPEEWAKAHGDFSRFGLTGPEVIPYISTEDRDAMPGQPPTDSNGDSRRLMGSALSAFILAHRAGLKADFPREYGDWAKRPMLLLPYPLTSTSDPFLVHMHTDFYEKARKYVEGGGFLYASISADAGIPEMEALFGARMVDAITAPEVTLKVVADFGTLKAGDTFRYTLPASSQKYWGSILEIKGGKVIAVDQDGHPALVTNSVGKGKTLLSAYPLESYLAAVPSVFEKAEGTHRIYDSFRTWVGLNRSSALTSRPWKFPHCREFVVAVQFWLTTVHDASPVSVPTPRPVRRRSPNHRGNGAPGTAIAGKHIVEGEIRHVQRGRSGVARSDGFSRRSATSIGGDIGSRD